MTLNEVLNKLGIEKKTSKTLESMSKEEILSMTPEQAKAICEEVGTGWTKTRDDGIIESLSNADLNPDGTIMINFELN